MHESDIAIKNEIAKVISNNNITKDIDLSSIINTNVNLDLDSFIPKFEKHCWSGNIKISLKIR